MPAAHAIGSSPAERWGRTLPTRQHTPRHAPGSPVSQRPERTPTATPNRVHLRTAATRHPHSAFFGSTASPWMCWRFPSRLCVRTRLVAIASVVAAVRARPAGIHLPIVENHTNQRNLILTELL